MKGNELTEQIIGAAIEVHKHLGPGLLENAYEECLCYELEFRELKFRRQLGLPVRYKGVNLDCGYRVDILVENRVIVELKAIEKLLDIHEAQLLTYLKVSDLRVELLLNFSAVTMMKGVKRIVNGYEIQD